MTVSKVIALALDFGFFLGILDFSRKPTRQLRQFFMLSNSAFTRIPFSYRGAIYFSSLALWVAAMGLDTQ